MANNKFYKIRWGYFRLSDISSLSEIKEEHQDHYYFVLRCGGKDYTFKFHYNKFTPGDKEVAHNEILKIWSDLAGKLQIK